MMKVTRSFIFAFLLALICLPPLHAQKANGAATDANSTPANQTSSGQAPDDMTAKITQLVHAGKYSEAQQLTTGLLVAYPNDQRLMKAKALLEKLLATPGSAKATPSSDQPAALAKPKKNTDAEEITGLDKVDYSALIVLARQAQQTRDLLEQETLLRQFMDQSRVFLQKHPDQMLLWQLRAASAISLNSPMAGYEAAQKLLAMGAGDSDDPNLPLLLGQLKNKHWLDKGEADRQAKYGWLLGTWSLSCAETDQNGNVQQRCDAGGIEFSKRGSSDSVAEGYRISVDGVKSADPAFRVTILDPGEIRCEQYSAYGSPKWIPVLSCKTADNNRSLTISAEAYKRKGNTWTSLLHKN